MKKFVLLFILFIILLWSCPVKGDDGDDGDKGKKGVTTTITVPFGYTSEEIYNGESLDQEQEINLADYGINSNRLVFLKVCNLGAPTTLKCCVDYLWFEGSTKYQSYARFIDNYFIFEFLVDGGILTWKTKGNDVSVIFIY